MSYNPQFDHMLFAILNHVEGVDKFLEVMFSFLYRRTDFFVVKKDSCEKQGLPPGVAQKMVKAISEKYVKLEKAKEANSMKSEASSSKVCQKRDAKASDRKPSEKQKVEGTGIVVKSDSASQDPDSTPKQDSASSSEESLKATNGAEEMLGKCSDEDKKQSSKAEDEDEEEDFETRHYESNPECYNGASYNNYCWSQDIYELDVQVKVPKDVKRGDQVKVDIKRARLTVEVSQNDNWQVLLDGVLSYEVKAGGSTWTLNPGDHVHVQLEKAYDRYWEALLEGEPKINVRKIDCSRPYESLDPEAQAKLQEMMFDQHQKRLGKPSIQQIKAQEIMKKAWNQQDSPFKGQEFDPSLLDIAK